jgi:cell division protein FtsB
MKTCRVEALAHPFLKTNHKKYNKENERNKQNPADEQKVSKLEREIKKLKTQIAKLSDEFYGNYTDNEYYT